MVAQITILLAESCRVILERCLVGVAEARIGQTLVVADATDGIGLKSSAGAKSTLWLNLCTRGFLIAMVDEVDSLAVGIDHTGSLRCVVCGVVCHCGFDLTGVSILRLLYLIGIWLFGLERASDLFRNLATFLRQFTIDLNWVRVKTFSLSCKSLSKPSAEYLRLAALSLKRHGVGWSETCWEIGTCSSGCCL